MQILITGTSGAFAAASATVAAAEKTIRVSNAAAKSEIVWKPEQATLHAAPCAMDATT